MTSRRACPLYTVALTLLLTAATAGTAAPTPPPPPSGFALQGDMGRGKALYASRCAICHGDKGNGQGQLKGTTPKPTDFTDRAKMGKRSDWELYRVIRDGGPALGLSPQMMPWGQMMTDQEIRDTAAYVRGLAKR